MNIHSFFLTIVLLSFLNSSCFSQKNMTLNQRLGYAEDAKLLIIHADDMGVSHSENIATFKSMSEGVVNSGSIMVPCPWFPEAAEYARENPEADLGLHLTLTSEWKHFRWGPVTAYSEVPSLVNEQNFLHAGTEGVAKNADPEHVKQELIAQVERAKAFGIAPTHLDTHMGSLLGTPDLFKAYLEVGREYKLPVLLAHNMMGNFPDSYSSLVTDEDIVIDNVYTANPQDMENGMAAYYERVMRELPAGVSTFLIHVAFDNDEMQGVTVEHPDWGAKWRQADYDFFMSEEAKKILEEENIQLITWREIGKLLK